jgi:hypothetical protein
MELGPTRPWASATGVCLAVADCRNCERATAPEVEFETSDLDKQEDCEMALRRSFPARLQGEALSRRFERQLTAGPERKQHSGPAERLVRSTKPKPQCCLLRGDPMPEQFPPTVAARLKGARLRWSLGTAH